MFPSDGQKTVGHDFLTMVSQGQFFWLGHSVIFNFLLSLFYLFPPLLCVIHSFCPQDKVSLCNPGCAGSHSASQDSLKIRELTASPYRCWYQRSVPPHIVESFSLKQRLIIQIILSMVSLTWLYEWVCFEIA